MISAGKTKAPWDPILKGSPDKNKNSSHSYLCLSINQDTVNLGTVAKKLVIKIWEYWLFQVPWKLGLRKLIKHLRKAKQTLEPFPEIFLSQSLSFKLMEKRLFQISANIYPKSFTRCLTASRSTLKIFLWSSKVLVALLKYI